MSSYALHPGAFADLDEIRAYVAAENADAADRVIADIFARIRDVAAFPNQGFRRPELTSAGVRFVLQREYLIAYVPERKPIWVLAVIHARRSPRTIKALLTGRR